VQSRSVIVGETEIIALVDAVPEPVDRSWSFPKVPRTAWQAHTEGSLDPAGRFRPNLGCLAVRTPERTVLIDLGIGPGPNAYLNGISGRLPDLLAEAGLRFADMAAVVFTHLHMDHVGWAATRDASGEPHVTFPDVRHFVAERELSFWEAPPASVGAHHKEAFGSCIVPLLRADLVETVDGDAEFLPGVSLVPTPGHTPGHSSVMLRSEGQTIVIAGDVFHCPAQVEQPAWSHRADIDAERARESRATFLARAAHDEWLVAAGHFRDGWMFGRIERSRGTYRYRPAEGA
jgi:glyoxylase-like metal-dependent hydrolase (beta-lactamase superfamily II)